MIQSTAATRRRSAFTGPLAVYAGIMAKKELTVDNDPYEWDDDEITYQELKDLADIPDGVLIFHKIPGKPDQEVKAGDAVNLADTRGIDRFSTQSPQSGAGHAAPTYS